MKPPIFSDLELARRLERAEGLAGAQFVDARARVAPSSGAQWIQMAGVDAMFDGVESPLTQTFDLGLGDGDADLDRLGAFFKERGAPVFHEVCPLAGVPLLTSLVERGYKPVELSNVIVPSVEPGRGVPGFGRRGERPQCRARRTKALGGNRRGGLE